MTSLIEAVEHGDGEPPERDASGTPVWAGAGAGVVAAACALAAGELPSAIAGESQSLITTVGNEFIDSFAAGLKEIAVALFGTNDKVALVVGIVVTSLALGGVFGVVARRRFWAGVVGFIAFGLVGMAAALTDPQAGTGAAIWGPVVAVVTGVGVLRLLLVRAPRHAAENADPTVKTPDRRSFLAFAGAGTAGAALVAAAGRSVRSANQFTVDEAEIAAQLPTPNSTIPIPQTGLDVPGLSPYLTPNEDFYRIDTALTIPRIDPDTWSMRVHGRVDNPIELTYADLLDMDMVETPVTLQCVSNEVGGDLVDTALWLGVPLTDVLDLVGVQRDATQIVGRSVDRFTVGFPTENAYDGRTALIAVGMNGEPLPRRHGFPARLVVSGLYGYVSATKWLSDIELTRFEDFDAYWVPRGWSKIAPIKPASRIDVPRRGAKVDAGRVAVAGVAWSPDLGINGVEVQVDDGDWMPARLGEVANEDTWVQWVLDWDAPAGEHLLRVRCIDANGIVQDGANRPPAPDGATGWHTIRVDVG